MSASISYQIRHQIAESLLGGIDWQSEVKGFAPCPGEYLHTKRTKQNHCFIAVDGAPTIHCFHSSCLGIVENKNNQLRSAIGKAEIHAGIIPSLSMPSVEMAEIQARKKHAEDLKIRAKTSLETILRDYAWNPVDAWHESPVISPDMELDWKLMLSLFNPTDVLWIGDIYDSGKLEHSSCFRTVREWNEIKQITFPLTCPSTFKPGSYSRCNEAVISRPFLVVESDTLNKDQICSVFKWCQLFMSLRAVIDTGGKSLHAWFDFPEPEVLSELKIILPQLQCDPALFKPAQPCRMPGVKRGDKWQSLVWFGGAK